MPKGTVLVRAENVRKAGNAKVEITEMLYDDCVKYTAKLARDNTTIMAGLNCATPCGIAWSYLRDFRDYLQEHITVENEVIFPRALQLESQYVSQYA